MSCTTGTTAGHPLPRAPYPPLPDGPCVEHGRVVLPPRTGLVARDLLAALLAGLYDWQHAALDLTLTFDRHVRGRRQPYAVVGRLLGRSIDLVPRDDAGVAWALVVGCPDSDLSCGYVPLSSLRTVLAAIMLALYERRPSAYRARRAPQDATRRPPLPPPAWHARAQALMLEAGLPAPVLLRGSVSRVAGTDILAPAAPGGTPLCRHARHHAPLCPTRHAHNGRGPAYSRNPRRRARNCAGAHL